MINIIIIFVNKFVVQFIMVFGKFFNSSKEVIREITMLFTLQNMQ